MFWILLDSLKLNSFSINPAGKRSVCFRNVGFILTVNVMRRGQATSSSARHPLFHWNSMEEVRTTLRASFLLFLLAVQRSGLGTPSAPAFALKISM